MKLPKLYSRRSDGGVQEWSIEVEGGAYRMHSGIHGGSIVTTEWTKCQGKNAGRSNATSPAEQAAKEAKAVWQKKVDEGYHSKLEDIDIETFFAPMLAKKYDDYPEISFPVYAQPKLDGMRCVVAGTRMTSRNGKVIVSAPHVLAAMQTFMRGKARGKTAEGLVFDGELYCDKLANDFNKIISLAKKGKPSPADLAESAKTLQYWIYDCFDPNSPGLTFRERKGILDELFGQTSANGHQVLIEVPTLIVGDQEALDNLFGTWLEAGYEGQMIRRDAIYENTRTKSLLKRKIFQDAEYPVVDVLPGVGNRAGVAGAVVHSLPDGRTFRSGLIGDMDYCRRLLVEKDKAIGQKATVVYFNLTPDGVPRFPKLKAIRNYE